MRDSSLARTLLRIVLIVCAPLVLLLSNLYVAATPAFIRWEYAKSSFPPAWRYGAAERLSLAEATLHYLRSGEPAQYLTDLSSEGGVVYNLREVEHLVDVKVVMSGAFWVHGVCAMLCGLAITFSWRLPRERAGVLLALSQGCLGFLALMAAVGLLACANFNVFFTIFHLMFFEGDTWLFSFSDTLIQLFPVPFWMDATWLIAVLTALECGSVGMIAYALSRRQRGTP